MKHLRDTNSHDRALLELSGERRGADTNASPGAPPSRKAHSKRFRNLFCECGQPAVIRSANSMACQRCADMTSGGDFQTTSGVKDRAEPYCGWSGIRAECLGFFKRNGMESGVFHG